MNKSLHARVYVTLVVPSSFGFMRLLFSFHKSELNLITDLRNLNDILLLLCWPQMTSGDVTISGQTKKLARRRKL